MNYKRKALLLLMLIIVCSFLCTGLVSCGAKEYQTVSVGSSLDNSQSLEEEENSSTSEEDSESSSSISESSDSAEDSESSSTSSESSESEENSESASTSLEESSESQEDESSSLESSENESDSSSEDSSSDEEIEHKHSYALIETKEATCEEDGYILYGCACTVTYRDTLPAFKHDVSIVQAVEGTCIHRGLSEGSYCTRCEKTLVKQQETEYGTHSMSNCVCLHCGLLELKYELRYDYDEIGYTAPYYACSMPVGVDESKVHRIIIPDTYQGKAVAYVVKNAFIGFYGLYSVEIGANVVKIEKGAFNNCINLVEVYDRSLAQISKLSHSENGYLTAYAKKVYTSAYSSNITQARDGFVTYQEGNETILIGYDGEEKNAVIPEGVTTINSHVFSKNDKTTSISIPSTVTYVNALAFENCVNLEEIVLKEPNGWVSSEQVTGVWLPYADDLSNPKTAYQAFVEVFKYHYWKRNG